MSEFMDEERMGALVEELVSVLVKHIKAAVYEQRSGWPQVLGPIKMTPKEASEYIGVNELTLS